MNIRKTLTLGILLVAVLLFIFQVELPHQEEERRAGFLLGGVSGSELSEVTISKNGEKIVLRNLDPKKEAPKSEAPAEESLDFHDHDHGEDEAPVTDVGLSHRWELGDIAGAGLDSGRISSLLSALTSMEGDTPLPKDEIESDVSVYGLSNPLLTVEAVHEGKKTVFEIGKENSFLGKRYVRIQGAPEIYLVSNQVFEAASRSKSEFRDTSPITFKDEEVKTLELDNGVLPTRVDRVGDGWRLVHPVTGTGAKLALSEFMMSLRNLKATDFTDEPTPDLKRFGLDAPSLKVVVSFKDEKTSPLVARIGVVGEKAFLRLGEGGTIYTVSHDAVKKLRREPDSLRERKLNSFDVSAVSAVRVEGTLSGEWTIERGDSGWMVNGKRGDEAFVTQYLRDLSGLSADSFVLAPAKDAAFDAPRMKVTITFGSGEKKREQVLRIGAATKGGVFAAVGDPSEPFVVSDSALKKITPREEVLLAKEEPTPTVTPSPAS